MTPQQHLTKACEALDVVRGFKPGPGTVDVTVSLSTFATAHLLAAQVKMEASGQPHGTNYAWERS